MARWFRHPEVRHPDVDDELQPLDAADAPDCMFGAETGDELEQSPETGVFPHDA
jgi:hypothetical protein